MATATTLFFGAQVEGRLSAPTSCVFHFSICFCRRFGIGSRTQRPAPGTQGPFPRTPRAVPEIQGTSAQGPIPGTSGSVPEVPAGLMHYKGPRDRRREPRARSRGHRMREADGAIKRQASIELSLDRTYCLAFEVLSPPKFSGLLFKGHKH